MSVPPRDEDLAAMLSRAPDDPVRIAWAADPANQALLDTFEAFQGIETDDDDEAAAAVLAAALRQDLGTAKRRRRGPRIPRGLALAASIVLMVGGGLLVARGLQPPGVDVSGTLRGEEDAVGIASSAAVLDDGRVWFRWTTDDGTTGDLVVLDAALREVRRVPLDGNEITLATPPDAAFYLFELRHADGTSERSAPRAWP